MCLQQELLHVNSFYSRFAKILTKNEQKCLKY